MTTGNNVASQGGDRHVPARAALYGNLNPVRKNPPTAGEETHLGNGPEVLPEPDRRIQADKSEPQ